MKTSEFPMSMHFTTTQARPEALLLTARQRDRSEELIISDTSCPQIRALLAGALHPVTTLAASREHALVAISDALRNTNPRTLHLVAHGQPGAFRLGDQWITAQTLANHASHLGSWGVERIALWSCETGADRGFVSLLSELTGAEVFSATAALQGGSMAGWSLKTTGSAQGTSTLPAAFSADAIASWTGSLAAVPDDTSKSNDPRSATVGGEVFLGGTFIELGLANSGSFGTTGSAPDTFFGTPGGGLQLGMSADSDGFGTGFDRRIDYFVPGSPEERWSLGFLGTDGSQRFGGFSTLNGPSTSGGIEFVTNSIADTSSGTTLSATLSGTLRVDGSDFLKVDFRHFFGKDDKLFTTDVTLTNLSGSAINGLRFMRSHDPDNTRFYVNRGNFTTLNTLIRQASSSGSTFVQAQSLETDAYNTDLGEPALIGYFSQDVRSKGYVGGFENPNPFDIDGAFDPIISPQAEGFTSTNDEAIGIAFDINDLAAGASKSFSYKTVLDFTTAGEVLNPPPTVTPPAPTLAGTRRIDGLNGTPDPDVIAYTWRRFSRRSRFDTVTNYSSDDSFDDPINRLRRGRTLAPLTSSIKELPRLTRRNLETILTASNGYTKFGAVAFDVAGKDGTFFAVNDKRLGFQGKTDLIIFLEGYEVGASNPINIV